MSDILKPGTIWHDKRGRGQAKIIAVEDRINKNRDVYRIIKFHDLITLENRCMTFEDFLREYLFLDKHEYNKSRIDCIEELLGKIK